MSPIRPKRACLVPTCGQDAVREGRCAQHSGRPNEDVRRWYRTARWAALRAQKLAENPLCVACQAEGRITPWTELDHHVPHRGRTELFWDSDNLRGLCQRHHAEKTARGQ